MHTVRRLMHIARPFAGKLLLVALLTSVGALAELLEPWVYRAIINDIAGVFVSKETGLLPQILEELRGAALIREVHVYGPVVRLGHEAARAEAQHLGLGAELIRAAEQRARQAGYPRLAVISAIGTREYYRRHGFELGDLYMAK